MAITFNGTAINSINGLEILDIIEPPVIPKQKNKVKIPGRDGSYNFGNNKKQDFLISIDFIISPGSYSGTVYDSLNSLRNLLDTESPQTLETFTGSYSAEVFGAGDIETNKENGLVSLEGTITFECDASSI